jgi:hypothetical protein
VGADLNENNERPHMGSVRGKKVPEQSVIFWKTNAAGKTRKLPQESSMLRTATE